MAGSVEDYKKVSEMDSEDDDEGWHEVLDDDVEHNNVKCVFCQNSFHAAGALWGHCAESHYFDITKFKQKCGLDCYSYIKLINFLRKEQPTPKILFESVPPYPWEDDRFLQPVLPDDPLLHYGNVMPQNVQLSGRAANIEDSDNEEDIGKEHTLQNGNSCAQSSDENNEMKKKLILAEERASKAETALHQALSDLDVMRAGVQSIVLGSDHDIEYGESLHSVEDEDGYFSTYSHYSIHEEMLKDKVRTLSYKNFMDKNRSLFEGKVVLDIGCGSGILSIFAAQAGAKKVIGIDKSSIIYNAMDIVRENKLDNIIKLKRGKAEEVDLEGQQVDVIISEWMGYFLLFESMLDTVLFARDKWLTTNGKVYPDKCTMSVVGLADDKRSEEKLTFWDDIYGVKMSCMKHFVLSEPVVDIIDPSVILTSSCVIKEIDVNKANTKELDFKSNFQLEVCKDGILNIIVGYFDIFFDESCSEKISFSTHPSSPATHWKQTLFYLENPVPLKKGEVVSGSLQCRKNKKDIRSLDIVINLQDNASKEVITNKYTLQ